MLFLELNLLLPVIASTSGDPSSSSKSYTTLYVCIPIIVLSVSLNVYFIIRQLRNRNSVGKKQKDHENAKKHIAGGSKDSDQAASFSKSVYDTAEDKAAYQELGEITKESQYDKLSWQHSNGILLNYEFCQLKLDFIKAVKPYNKAMLQCIQITWWHKSSYSVPRG